MGIDDIGIAPSLVLFSETNLIVEAQSHIEQIKILKHNLKESGYHQPINLNF